MAEMTQVSQNGNEQTKIRSKKNSTRIDMTPMVDLAFLLLTFFVMTTTLTKPFALRMDMPEKSTINKPATPIADKQALTIILDKNDNIYWYEGITDPKIELTNFSKNGIRKIIARKNKEIRKMVVLIKATDQSKYKNLVDILDEMIINDIERFAIVDITPVDKEMIKSK